MHDAKQIKKKYIPEFRKNPDKYYPVPFLKEKGLHRSQCSKCQKYFWSIDKDRTVCGDAVCLGGYTFLDVETKRKDLSYIETWKEYSRIMEKQGYAVIPRYPVIARWREDIPFVEAGIDNFIPYVVDGISEAPANPLVQAQPCLRFNDVDNVGITGAHFSAFSMLGQQAFVPSDQFKQTDYFKHLMHWFEDGINLPMTEMIIHEDVWAGSGNFGPCLEIFSDGLELANQVYMQFQETSSGKRDLNLKVCDMGMGHERIPWFTQRTSTAYETTFPTVLQNLRNKTGIKIDESMRKKFLPYAGLLNADEVEDLQKMWEQIGEKINEDPKHLKNTIRELEALFSVAEHSRALLFAISDGGLPSNVGGGYNLRIILRRALSFINKYEWDIYLPQVCEWHAAFLKPLWPELSERLDDVRKILDVEEQKFQNTLDKGKRIVGRLVQQEHINTEKLLTLYDSDGIDPGLIRDVASEAGKKIDIPDNFYALVAERHKQQSEHAVQTTRKDVLEISEIKPTSAQYYDDYEIHSFDAAVITIDGKFVVLDRTFFYPTSGGQLHDIGVINDQQVVDVFKQGPVIIHELKDAPNFKKGNQVKCVIDNERRKQLAQHHTATHVLNAAAKEVLGPHIYQAGARKILEKATLDVTHYKKIEQEELKAIEKRANQIIKEDLPVRSLFKERNDAEKEFGMNIYQGGAVPGKQLRIIQIPEVDVEACGGTHVKFTSDIGKIKILKSSKIQDGIVRLEFVAGNAAEQFLEKEDELVKQLGINVEELGLIAGVFDVHPKEVPKTIERFMQESYEALEQVQQLEQELQKEPSSISVPDTVRSLIDARALFKSWKDLRKKLEHLKKEKSVQMIDQFKDDQAYKVDMDVAMMRSIVETKHSVLLINKQGSFVTGSMRFFEILKKHGAKGGGKEIMQGKIDLRKIQEVISLCNA